MKSGPAVSKLRKALTRVLKVTRALARDAESDYLNDRLLPTGFKGRHTRQRAKITRALRTAWHCATLIGDAELNRSLIAIENLTKEVIEHSLGFFPNNDYDARPWRGWEPLADMRVKIVEARYLLKERHV
jgi:hypothetical protein